MKVLEGEGTSRAWWEVRELWLGARPEQVRSFRIRNVRGGGELCILELEGVQDREQAGALRGLQVFVDRAQLPEPEEGCCYAGELIGLLVQDPAGKILGVLDEIFDNGAHEVYVVKGERGEILLPVLQGVVLEVDLENRRMVVSVPPGLPGL